MPALQRVCNSQTNFRRHEQARLVCASQACLPTLRSNTGLAQKSNLPSLA